MSTRRALQFGVVIAAVLAAVLPLPAALVERWYATAAYPRLQQVLTPLSNAVPFAILDLLVIGAVAGVVVGLVRRARLARSLRRAGPLLAIVRPMGVAAAVVYLVFLLLWGLNYRRVDMSDRLVMRQDPPRPEEVLALGLQAVERMNTLHAEAHASGFAGDPWRDAGLRRAFDATQRLLSDAPPAQPGRLKASLLGPYFRWASIDGMIDPFALEVLANPDLLPWERPFVAAHEWAHLAGYAHETEANFVGWLTCMRGGAGVRYSGWIHVYWQVAAVVAPHDRMRLDETLMAGPREDLEAIYARVLRGRLPALHDASWAVYDQYLKANRVEEGLRSYGEVLDLIVRARFDHDWVPVRRGEGRPSSW